MSVTLTGTANSPGVVATDDDCNKGGYHGYHGHWGGYDRHRGLEGKDASFLVGAGLGHILRDVSKEISDVKCEVEKARFEPQLHTAREVARLVDLIRDAKDCQTKEIFDLKMNVFEKHKETTDILKDFRIKDLEAKLAACQCAEVVPVSVK